MTLGEQTAVEYSTETISFDKVKDIVKKFNTFSNLSEIIHEICVGEIVNIDVYVNEKEAAVNEVNTKFGVKRKKDVLVSDNSHDEYVKLTLWNNHIQSIPESGTYKFQDLRVNSFNGKYLTTTSGTIIQTSDTVIERKVLHTKDIVSTVSFPVETINLFEQSHFCKKCKRKAVPTGVFIHCDSCGSKSLLVTSEQRFDVKVTFVSGDDVKLTLGMPHKMFMKFAELVSLPIEDVEQIQIKMLTCNNIKATFSTKTNMISSIHS